MSNVTRFIEALQRFISDPDNEFNQNVLVWHASSQCTEAFIAASIKPDDYLDYLDKKIGTEIKDVIIGPKSGLKLEQFIQRLSAPDVKEEDLDKDKKLAFHTLTLVYYKHLKPKHINKNEEDIFEEVPLNDIGEDERAVLEAIGMLKKSARDKPENDNDKSVIFDLANTLGKNTVAFFSESHHTTKELNAFRKENLNLINNTAANKLSHDGANWFYSLLRKITAAIAKLIPVGDLDKTTGVCQQRCRVTLKKNYFSTSSILTHRVRGLSTAITRAIQALLFRQFYVKAYIII